MNRPDPNLAAIAREYLFIPTLETRRADSLDFHHVAVWQVEAALKAAFDAGVRSADKNAAPKLLEALIAAPDWIDAQLGEPRSEIQAQVEQAIAAATGEGSLTAPAHSPEPWSYEYSRTAAVVVRMASNPNCQPLKSSMPMATKSSTPTRIALESFRKQMCAWEQRPQGCWHPS